MATERHKNFRVSEYMQKEKLLSDLKNMGYIDDGLCRIISELPPLTSENAMDYANLAKGLPDDHAIRMAAVVQMLTKRLYDVDAFGETYRNIKEWYLTELGLGHEEGDKEDKGRFDGMWM